MIECKSVNTFKDAKHGGETSKRRFMVVVAALFTVNRVKGM